MTNVYMYQNVYNPYYCDEFTSLLDVTVKSLNSTFYSLGTARPIEKIYDSLAKDLKNTYGPLGICDG